MHHFHYRDDRLHAEDVPIEAIAAQIGTPFYCYAAATLRRHYRVFADALSGQDALICYALKANSNLAVIRTLAELGAGADIVSDGELERALRAGIAPDRIVFSGVGKTEDEIARALAVGIRQLNVESVPELEAIQRVAARLGKTAPVTIRVNPDVKAETHEKITTGRKGDKFGIDWDRAPGVFALAATMANLEVRGVSVHIGSQITDLAPFEAAFGRVGELVQHLRAEGHDIQSVDLGGGLGIPYGAPGDTGEPPAPAAYGEMIRRVTGNWGATLILEPGRLIAGNAGILVTKTLYVKDAGARRYLIVDAAMNDLIRPSFYDAHHTVWPVDRRRRAAVETFDVVGPICETGDVLARGRDLARPEEGDLVAFLSAGAYGAVMSSTYNSRPLLAEVLVDGDRWAVVRRRQTVDEMLALETAAPWQGDTAGEAAA